MTIKGKKAAHGSKRKTLKLKKETLKDLDAKGKARKVKGGAVIIERGTGCLLCSVSCLPNLK